MTSMTSRACGIRQQARRPAGWRRIRLVFDLPAEALAAHLGSDAAPDGGRGTTDPRVAEPREPSR